MHVPDGPAIGPRDEIFARLDSELDWIHSHDAHAEHRPAVDAASARP